MGALLNSLLLQVAFEIFKAASHFFSLLHLVKGMVSPHLKRPDNHLEQL